MHPSSREQSRMPPACGLPACISALLGFGVGSADLAGLLLLRQADLGGNREGSIDFPGNGNLHEACGSALTVGRSSIHPSQLSFNSPLGVRTRSVFHLMKLVRNCAARDMDPRLLA